MAAPSFRTEFDPRHGEAVPLGHGVHRITANNPSPFTFHGTNSYIVEGASAGGALAVVDPGPDRDAHYDALMRAVDGRPVSHILVTHTHVDHSPLAARLKRETGAVTVAEGPHRPARPLHGGEINALDASADADFRPDIAVSDGDVVEGDGWALTAVLTPGHTANHAAFALRGTDVMFSGDHVMAWSTSIVAPPDGAMRDYMASLDRIAREPQSLYLPGHGGELPNAHAFVRALRTHRRMRERDVLAQVEAGRDTIPAMVAVIYATTDPRLHGAAGLSVLAHLEDLVERGAVRTDGPPRLDGRYRPA